MPLNYDNTCHAVRQINTIIIQMPSGGDDDPVIDSFRDIMDSNIYLGEAQVDKIWMYVILIGSITVLGGVYVLLNRLKNKN